MFVIRRNQIIDGSISEHVPNDKAIMTIDFPYIYDHDHCLASPANFIYGRVLAKVLSHVTIMPVLLRPVNNFLGQVIGNASKGKYNTVNNSSSGE